MWTREHSSRQTAPCYFPRRSQAHWVPPRSSPARTSTREHLFLMSSVLSISKGKEKNFPNTEHFCQSVKALKSANRIEFNANVGPPLKMNLLQ